MIAYTITRDAIPACPPEVGCGVAAGDQSHVGGLLVVPHRGKAHPNGDVDDRVGVCVDAGLVDGFVVDGIFGDRLRGPGALVWVDRARNTLRSVGGRELRKLDLPG
ncbi:hypothetical protein ABT187_45115 [Streptomyces sp. NPDC001817]|uniref:hypothetical protein n=1 Tax=Streptomyces sp. NPDC001817 TaxID=3154398 RepID=UPI0033239737